MSVASSSAIVDNQFWMVAMGKAIDIKKVAELIGVEKEMAYLHTRKKNFPISCFTISRKKYWKLSEVTQWIKENRS